MKQVSDVLYTICYKLITDEHMYLMKDQNNVLAISDRFSILKDMRSVTPHIVKLINGNSLPIDKCNELLEANISNMIDSRNNRTSIGFSTLVFICDSYNYKEIQRLALNSLSRIENDDLPLSLLVLSSNTMESSAYNQNRSRLKKTASFIIRYFHDLENSNTQLYSLNNCLDIIQERHKATSKLLSNNSTPVTYTLIVICVIMFALTLLAERFTNSIDYISFYGAVNKYFILQQHQFWRLFTAMFLHSSVMHLICNMYSLYVLGRIIERLYGSFKFLEIYVITGLCGNILSALLQSNTEFGLGASGAILGLGGVLVYLWIFEKSDILHSIYNLTPLIVMIVFNVFYGFLIPSSNIGNWAHLGGFLSGLALTFILNKFTKNKI